MLGLKFFGQGFSHQQMEKQLLASAHLSVPSLRWYQRNHVGRHLILYYIQEMCMLELIFLDEVYKFLDQHQHPSARFIFPS